MVFYEVMCICCKQIFRVYEGTEKYNRYKKDRNAKFCCEECNHNIRLEAIKNFFR